MQTANEKTPMTILTPDGLVTKYQQTIGKHFPGIFNFQANQPPDVVTAFPLLREQVFGKIISDRDLQARFAEIARTEIDKDQLAQLDTEAALQMMDSILGIMKGQDDTEEFLKVYELSTDK